MHRINAIGMGPGLSSLENHPVADGRGMVRAKDGEIMMDLAHALQTERSGRLQSIRTRQDVSGSIAVTRTC